MATHTCFFFILYNIDMSTLTSRRKLAFIFLIIAAVIAAFVLVMWFGRNDTATVSSEVEQVSVDGVGTPEGKLASGISTLTELAAKGSDLECQVVYEQVGAEGDVEGTFFTSKGNYRGDFMVPAAEFGGKILSSMIVGNNSMYVWSTINNEKFGFKTDIASGQSNKVDAKEPVPLDKPVKYSCVDWDEVDGSVFVPPADVTFQDLDAVIDAGMEYGTVPPGSGEF